VQSSQTYGAWYFLGILESQLATRFTTHCNYRSDFWGILGSHPRLMALGISLEFSKVSSLLDLLHKITIDLTFEFFWQSSEIYGAWDFLCSLLLMQHTPTLAAVRVRDNASEKSYADCNTYYNTLQHSAKNYCNTVQKTTTYDAPRTSEWRLLLSLLMESQPFLMNTKMKLLYQEKS